MGTFEAFRFRNFRLIWTGNLLSNIGSWMQEVAQPWLVLSLTHSPFLLGLDAFAGDAPVLALILFGGVVADRVNRRVVISVSQVVQALSAGLIALLIVTGHINVWIVIALSFLVGTMQSFSVPAYQALVPSLVDRPYISNAIALNSTQYNLSRIVGPVIAGVIMATLGAAWCFGLNALSFCAILYALWAIRLTGAAATAPRSAEAKGAAELSVGAGVRKIFGDPLYRNLLLVVAASSVFSGPLVTFIPVIAHDVYHLGAKGFSIALSAFGGGALLGALIVASRAAGPRLVRGSALVLAVFIAGLTFLPTITPSFWLTLPLFAVCGAAFIGCNASASTILQRTIADHYRGRASSIFSLAFRGGLPLGNLVTGITVTHWGVRRALLVNAVCALAIVAYLTLTAGAELRSGAAGAGS